MPGKRPTRSELWEEWEREHPDGSKWLTDLGTVALWLLGLGITATLFWAADAKILSKNPWLLVFFLIVSGLVTALMLVGGMIGRVAKKLVGLCAIGGLAWYVWERTDWNKPVTNADLIWLFIGGGGLVWDGMATPRSRTEGPRRTRFRPGEGRAPSERGRNTWRTQPQEPALAPLFLPFVAVGRLKG